MGKRKHETAASRSEPSALQESVQKYYREMSPERVDEIITDRSAEAYVQRLCGLVANYRGGFSSEQMDKIIDAVGADFSVEEENNPDFWGGVHPHRSLSALSGALAGGYGGEMSEAQVGRLVDGHLVNDLGVAALSPLLTQHGRDLEAYADRFLEASINPYGDQGYGFSAAVIERYGGRLRPEQIDELLGFLIADKRNKREQLEAEISRGGEVYGWLAPLNGRAEGIHAIFASLIQYGPELSAEQTDQLIESGHDLTRARLLAFKLEHLASEQYQAILSLTSPTGICRQLVGNELPMPANKEQLLDGMIDELESLDWRQQKTAVGESYVRHFSAGNMNRLTESGSELLFEALGNWPGELEPGQIDAVIDKWEASLPIAFVRQLGASLSPAQAERVVNGSRPEVAAALIDAHPEHFSLFDTESKIDMLLRHGKNSLVQKRLIKNYGHHFLPRQVDALLDYRYGPSVEEFIELHPDKFSPEQIKRAISGSMVKVGKRSELFAMHRQAYLAEADELIASGSPLTEYLIEQCGNDLSSGQIDQLIEADDFFYTQHRILEHCAQRLSSEQIDRFMDMIEKRGGLSVYEKVTRREREPKAMIQLVAAAGDRMTPAQLDRIIDGRRHYQRELVSELLAKHERRLSTGQIDRIIARFGHAL